MSQLNKINITDFFKPTPKQAEALKYVGKGYNIFYGGARGGGKTDLSIFACFLSALLYPRLKCCIIRATYKELNDEIVDRTLKTYPAKYFKYKFKNKDKIITFENESSIYFRAIFKKRDLDKIQGVEFQLIVIDEANNFEQEMIEIISASLRTSKHQDFVPTLLMTGNPLGKADSYFISHFVQPDYSMWTDEELKNKDKYVFIPAKLSDNPYANPEYRERLEMLSPVLREAYLEGKWGMTLGQFFDMWNPEIHIVEPFEIPKHWTIKSGLDLGWSTKHPTFCVWVAQDPVTQTCYVFQEYEGVANTTQYANDILAIEKDWGDVETFADPNAFYIMKPQDSTADSDAAIFLRAGKFLRPAVNDRKLGWTVLKQWLSYNKNGETKLKIFSTCRRLIYAIPRAQYSKDNKHKEDLDTNGFDDPLDALRYVMISGFTYPVEETKPAEEPHTQPTHNPYALQRDWKHSSMWQWVDDMKALY